MRHMPVLKDLRGRRHWLLFVLGGIVLALIVVAIVLSLFGFWIAGIPIAVVGAVLFVVFLLGWGRRAAESRP